jgi:hypothetical protein
MVVVFQWVSQERKECGGEKHQMVGIGTIGGLPRLGGRHPHLVQWAVVTLPKADVGTRRERSACGFWGK